MYLHKQIIDDGEYSSNTFHTVCYTHNIRAIHIQVTINVK